MLFKYKWPFTIASVMMQNTKPDQDFEHLKLSMESWFSQYKYQNYLQNLDWGLNVKVCIKFRGLWAQLSASELSSISISSLSPAVNHLMTYTLYRALIFIRKRRSATRITLKKKPPGRQMNNQVKLMLWRNKHADSRMNYKERTGRVTIIWISEEQQIYTLQAMNISACS